MSVLGQSLQKCDVRQRPLSPDSNRVTGAPAGRVPSAVIICASAPIAARDSRGFGPAREALAASRADGYGENVHLAYQMQPLSAAKLARYRRSVADMGECSASLDQNL
jgi:hypothetical protein